MAKIAAQAQKLGWKLLGQNLGKGGQGDVELVERVSDPGSQRYAFKFLGERGGSKAHERFRQELKALTSITHTSIVKVVEYAQGDDGLQYYVMEYIDSAKSLRQRMTQNANPFFRDPLRAVDGFLQIVEALAECAKFGIVHRDLSPANVLVTDDARIILIDFGLCHIEEGHRITVTDEAVGTPHYRPPECSGYWSTPVDIRADLYSAGKILWSMVTNRMAFEREKPVFNAQCLATVLPDVPMSWHFHHVFEGTIRHDPSKRYANPTQALDWARKVRQLIIERYKPLELLAGGKCQVCGIGTYEYVPPPYQAALDKFNEYLIHVRHGYAVCSYCFHASFQAAEAQRQALAHRKNLE
jgi:serine/threonine protein kinase